MHYLYIQPCELFLRKLGPPESTLRILWEHMSRQRGFLEQVDAFRKRVPDMLGDWPKVAGVLKGFGFTGGEAYSSATGVFLINGARRAPVETPINAPCLQYVPRTPSEILQNFI